MRTRGRLLRRLGGGGEPPRTVARAPNWLVSGVGGRVTARPLWWRAGCRSRARLMLPRSIVLTPILLCLITACAEDRSSIDAAPGDDAEVAADRPARTTRQLRGI